jgi:hypothetical protein
MSNLTEIKVTHTTEFRFKHLKQISGVRAES